MNRGPTTDVSKFAPGFMLQLDFAFFNVESIRGFNSTFVAICSATSYPVGFSSRRKLPPIEILKCFVDTLRNQENKVEFIRVDEDGELEISSEFMKTYHNMNTIVKTTGEVASSNNGKRKIYNKTLANTTRPLILKSIHKK